MKEKIINYIETLEAKSLQADDYFIQRNELYISNQEKDKEIERLNNIIKEVREYIVTHKLYCFKYDNEELFEIVTDKKAKDKLLEILDKVD